MPLQWKVFLFHICLLFSVNTHFEERELQSALKEIRSFLYGDVCDVYVEYIKPNIRVRTLKVLEIIIFG